MIVPVRSTPNGTSVMWSVRIVMSKRLIALEALSLT